MGGLYLHDPKEFWTTVDQAEAYMKPLGEHIIDTNRKIRKTEFIYICGSKNCSNNCTENTGEVWGDVISAQKALWMSCYRNLDPNFKHSNLWKMVFLSFY